MIQRIFALLVILSFVFSGHAWAEEGIRVTNEATTGTTQNFLVKYTNTNPVTAIIATTSDTTGLVGIAQEGAGKTGTVLVAQYGTTTLTFDAGGVTTNHYVVASTTVAGAGHDSGVAASSSPPTGVQVIGVAQANVAGNANGTVDLRNFFTNSAGSGAPGGVSGDVQKNNGASGFSAAALNDNGTIIKATEHIDATSNALVTEVTNAGTTGTTVNKLAKLTGAPSTAVITATTDTDGAVGIVIGGAGTTSNAQIAFSGQASCVFDGATTAGHWVTISSSTAGDCHDSASASRPTGSQAIGVVLSTNAAGGTYSVALAIGFSATSGSGCTVGGSSGDLQKNNGASGCAAAAVNDNGTILKATETIDLASNTALAQEVANAGTTGTTVNKLAKLTGAPSTAVLAATTDTDNMLGIVIGGAGTTSNAQIAVAGIAGCVFDGATTAGDYVQISSSTAGDCHDAGATRPTSGQIIGRALSTNAAGGTFNVALQISTPGGGGAGALTLVGSSQTASNSADLHWTGLSGSEYQLHCHSLIPATATTNRLGIQFSEDNGSTWKSSGYSTATWYVATNNTDGIDTTSTSTAGILGLSGSANSGTSGASFDADIHDLSSTTVHKSANFRMTITGTNFFTEFGNGYYTADVGAVNGVRVVDVGASGNITSGVCSLYALSN